mgnify:CR=1 FL=1
MGTITCAEAIGQYRQVIIGECQSELLYADAADLCEVSDLVQEAHLHLLQCWPRLRRGADNLRACVRTETRWFIRRYLKQQRRRTFPPLDIMQLAGIPDAA